jgi:hypothetical protein
MKVPINLLDVKKIQVDFKKMNRGGESKRALSRAASPAAAELGSHAGSAFVRACGLSACWCARRS